MSMPQVTKAPKGSFKKWLREDGPALSLAVTDVSDVGRGGEYYVEAAPGDGAAGLEVELRGDGGWAVRPADDEAKADGPSLEALERRVLELVDETSTNYLKAPPRARPCHAPVRCSHQLLQPLHCRWLAALTNQHLYSHGELARELVKQMGAIASYASDGKVLFWLDLAEGHKLQSFKAAMRNTDEVVRATVRPHPRPRPPSR